MKDTWFSIGFIVLVRDRITKRGSKLVAWPFKELALDFMHTCSRSAQDQQRNSEKTLGSRKNRRSNQLQVRKVETWNIQWVRIIRIPLGRINISMHSDYPTLQNTRRILGGSITQRACFSETKIYFRLGLSDARQNEGRTKTRVILQRACF